MPEAIASVDWDQIKADLQNGQSPKDIGERTGISPNTIAQRCRRYGWLKPIPKPIQIKKQTMSSVIDAVSSAVTSVMRDTLREQQDAWKAREHKTANGLLRHVDKHTSKDDIAPKSLSSIASAAKIASDLGRRALDMDSVSLEDAFGAGMSIGGALVHARVANLEHDPGPSAVVEEKRAQVIEINPVEGVAPTDHT